MPVHADRRSIFVVPWGSHTYLGTTDTDYTGDLDDPEVSGADVDYVLAALNAVVEEPLRRSDVTATWAGLRPLLAASGHHRAPSARTADLSRRHRVTVAPDGLVTITGGKLTTYRKMAEDTVGAVGTVLGRRLAASPTKRLRLRGADGTAQLRKPGAGGAFGMGDAGWRSLVGRYGGEAPAVAALVTDDPGLARPLVPGLPYLAAEAVYAARYEMASCLEDVLARRTRALLLDAAACREAAPDVADLLGVELGWDEARRASECASIEATVRRELAGLDEVATAGERREESP